MASEKHRPPGISVCRYKFKRPSLIDWGLDFRAKSDEALSDRSLVNPGVAWIILAPHHFGQAPEMGVGGAADEVMLDDKGGEPEIVRRDCGAFVAPLEVEFRLVMGGLLIGQ